MDLYRDGNFAERNDGKWDALEQLLTLMSSQLKACEEAPHVLKVNRERLAAFYRGVDAVLGCCREVAEVNFLDPDGTGEGAFFGGECSVQILCGWFSLRSGELSAYLSEEPDAELGVEPSLEDEQVTVTFSLPGVCEVSYTK